MSAESETATNTKISRTPVTELSQVEVRLEREKLQLEREMLAFERERLEAERASWRIERETRGQVTTGLHVGVGILGLAVGVALLLGVVAGYTTGLDTGRSQVPLPRTVRIGNQFTRMLARTTFSPAQRPRQSPPPDFDFFSQNKRPREAQAAGNLFIIR